MNKKKKQSFIYSLVIIILLGSYFMFFDNKETTPTTLYGPYEVQDVVDGDTIHVNINGERTKVRFLGVDAPESVAPEEERNTEEGVKASEYTKKLLPHGSYVYLEYDNNRYDKYDRLLAYVYLDDKETMIERLLLQDGMAEVYDDPDNQRYTDEFYKINRQAEKEGKGIYDRTR